MVRLSERLRIFLIYNFIKKVVNEMKESKKRSQGTQFKCSPVSTIWKDHRLFSLLLNFRILRSPLGNCLIIFLGTTVLSVKRVVLKPARQFMPVISLSTYLRHLSQCKTSENFSIATPSQISWNIFLITKNLFRLLPLIRPTKLLLGFYSYLLPFF